MKLTAVLLLLVAVGVALAGPQRSSRRFTPRRSQVTAEEAAPEADPAEAEEPAKPRFRIAGRPSGSSFTPKRSSSVTPAPIVDAAPVEGAVAAPVPVARASAPVARAPAQASSPRSRSRGSRTFAESIKLANIPIEASQLEELEKSKQSLQRISSRPSSRPSSRVAVSKSPAPTIRKPSRPSSIRKPVEQPSTPAKTAEPETVVTTPSPRKPAGGDQEARRQRLLALKNRPRAGAKSSTPKNAEESMPEEKTAQASTASDAEIEGDMMEKKAETMKEKNVPKLDEEVNKTLDETIKSEAKQENEAMKKDMPAKDMGDKATDVEKAEKKMPEEAETSASAVTPEPEVSTTTTAAPSARPRRINSLSKLRASRPASGTRTGGSRPQASSSAPAREAPAPATEVQPRLSSRRGGRGNSRGGAALATPTRISRPSSRAQASRTAVTADQEADAAGEAPAAVTTGSSGSFRRKFKPASRRRFQTPLHPSIDEQTGGSDSRMEREEGRGPRRPRHSIAPEDSPVRALRAGRSTAPVGKQVEATEKKTRRAGVRSLRERLRGRKTNRMRINEKQKVKGETAEQSEKNKEKLKAVNDLEGNQPNSELGNRNTAGSTTVLSRGLLSRPNNRSPTLVKQRQNSKRPEKRRPRGRVGRRRRPIKFSAVATSAPLPSTTPETTTLPTPSSTTTSETTTLSSQSLTDDETSTVLSQSSSDFEMTTSLEQSLVISETTTSPLQPTTVKATTLPSQSTTTEATTLPPQSTTTTEAISLPLQSTTTEATTLPPQSTTTEATSLPPQSTTTEATSLPPQSTTTDAITLPPQSTTTEATSLPPQSTTTEATSLPPQSTTTTEAISLPPQSTTTEATTLPPQSTATTETTTILISTTTERTTEPSTTVETIILPSQSSTASQTTTLAPQSTTIQPLPRTRRPLPGVVRPTRQRPSTTTTPAPPTTIATTTKSPPPQTTTASPSTTTQTTSTTTQSISTTTVWKPRVAPEDPVDATFNRGGFRFQPHPSSESDITRRRGEVVLTEVGTLEDTPPQQVAAILRGLGGRRRGLARPPASRLPPTTKSAMKDEFAEPDYYYDDY